MSDTMTEYYALCLVAAGRSKDVTIAHRMALLSERFAVSSGDTEITLTDKGKDRMRRKGK